MLLLPPTTLSCRAEGNLRPLPFEHGQRRRLMWAQTHSTLSQVSTHNPRRYHIRRWQGDAAEGQEIARLWRESLLETGLTQSFGSRGRYGLAFPPIIKADPSTGVVSKLVRSYLRQQQAAALARELRAEAAKLEGKPREQGRALAEAQRLRRQRMFACLVAEHLPCQGEDSHERELAAYCLISISQPLALLPPPFPSSSPLLLYIDALAVGEAHRRLGNASRLLEAVDKLAQRWGRKSIWLRVCPSNTAAFKLYQRHGFEEFKIREPAWFRILRRSDDVLMYKPVQPFPSKGCFLRGGAANNQTVTNKNASPVKEIRTSKMSAAPAEKVYKWDEDVSQ